MSGLNPNGLGRTGNFGSIDTDRLFSPSRSNTVNIHMDNGDYVADGVDGSVERSTDLKTVIESSLATLEPTYGGKIMLSLEGVHTIDPVKIDEEAGVVFEGLGKDRTVLQLRSNSDDHMFEFTRTTDKYFDTFKHLSLKGNGDNNTTGDAIHFNAQCLDAFVFDCFIFKPADNGVYHEDAWNLELIRNTIEFADFGVYLENPAGQGDVKIRGGKMIYNDRGVYTRCDHTIISDVFFYQNEDKAIFSDGSTNYVNISDCHFNDNNVSAGSYDIRFAALNEANITGCTFDGNGNGVGAIIILSGEDVNISDFTIDNYPGDPFDVYSADRVRINGLGRESSNAEEPTSSNWQRGDRVEFKDTGDGSGNGVYELLTDGSTWNQTGSSISF